MNKNRISVWIWIIIVSIVVINTTGCSYPAPENNLKIVNDTSPASKHDAYLNKIILEDINLRSIASQMAEGCSSGNKECQVNSIYRYIVRNYDYYSDPRTREFIQGPYETMQVKGGDCEDLTILLNSLLENLGIRTYVVFTSNHAYSLACGMDIDDLRNEISGSSNAVLTTYYYIKKGENCVVLDATLGVEGYPGYGIQITGDKTALDSMTRQEYSLPQTPITQKTPEPEAKPAYSCKDIGASIIQEQKKYGTEDQPLKVTLTKVCSEDIDNAKRIRVYWSIQNEGAEQVYISPILSTFVISDLREYKSGFISYDERLDDDFDFSGDLRSGLIAEGGVNVDDVPISSGNITIILEVLWYEDFIFNNIEIQKQEEQKLEPEESKIVSSVLNNDTIKLMVSSVLDGDTIKLSNGETVRLIGLNAPEWGQECSPEATAKLNDFVLGKEVILEQDVDDKDQYGRLLRYIYVNGTFINLEIVRLSLAHKYEYGSNTKYSSQFEQAENEAKENKGCLWKLEDINYIQDKCIQITNFHFNAAGDDNYNLNNEYVTFENRCSYSINMDGWTIKDETASHIYTIPSFTSQSGATFTLYTGTGANTDSALYWGRASGDYAAIWNNGGDTLFLRDSKGNLVLSQSYSGY